MSGDYVICDTCGAMLYEKDDPVALASGETACQPCWNAMDHNDIPEGCRACGGPFPQCTTSCKVFND